VHPLAERVLSYIHRDDLLRAGDRVGVAVSGGIDSVAMLRLLLELRAELGIVLSVVHFNHKLRGAESDADQEFVANLAREHDLEFHTDSDDVATQAASKHISVEAAARNLRYRFFHSLFDEECAPENARPSAKLHKIVTGHTLDDQAETVLLRLIRGTGLKGLGGIHPRIVGENDAEELSGEIVRPLLGVRRRELERYLGELDQPWRDDSSNASAKFTRNRLRQLILPLLEREFNPSVAENLAELSDIARGEEDYWENEIAGWLGTTVHWSEPEWARGSSAALEEPSARQSLVQIEPQNSQLPERVQAPSPPMKASVSRLWLLGEPVAVQRRLIKMVGDRAGIPLEFKHIEEILRFAAEDGPCGKQLSLPLHWKVACDPESVMFIPPDPRAQERLPRNYQYELPLPGRVRVPEVGIVIEALRITPGAQVRAYNPEHLLDPDLLHGPLTVRNWQPGDRFWPAHTKSPKKIKELLQERHIAQPDRRLWPVIANGDEVVWVRGFPAPVKLQPKPDREALLIREIPSAEIDVKR
jgi:tRNA(Ile)-lysidine synthase